MNPQLRLVLIVAVLVLPSAFFLWANSDVPKFCDLHDDCIYFVSAKSLADGGGYRIASLPGEPAQTKYPPLYPALLSAAWRLNPEFPANLTLAAWLSWSALPAMLLLLSAYLPRLGFTGFRKWLFLALIAINPYTVLFSVTLLTEQVFIVFLVGSLILMDRADRRHSKVRAVGAGVVIGLGYLVRSAGIVALVAFPLYFLLRRRAGLAAAVAMGMAPFVAGWMGWVNLHQVQTSDPALMYYVDYAGYQRLNVSIEELPLILWKNLDGVVWSLGSLVIPRVFDSFLIKILTVVTGVAMISGTVRLVRQGKALGYTLFALGSVLLLVIWHFPPSERFVYPLFPLALAGLAAELNHLWTMIQSGFRHPDRSQRVVATALAGAAGLLLASSLGFQLYLTAVYLPEDARTYRDRHRIERDVLTWIKENTPPSATILTPRDPALFLATGRHAISRPVPPIYWYRQDREGTLEYARTLVPFARDHGLAYAYYNGIDFGWTVMTAEEDAETAKAIRSNAGLEEVFTHSGTAVFKFPVSEGLANSPDRTPDNRVNHSPREHDR